MDHDQRAADILGRLRASWGPDLIELLLKASAELPRRWREWPPERRFEYLRCRLRFTQDELARKAGLAQSQVSRIEGGADALLSTWRRLFGAMGFELVFLPASGRSVEELERLSEEGRPPGHWRRQRVRPRRRSAGSVGGGREKSGRGTQA